MDPPPRPPISPSSTAKLRLMVSYGGHILPRPHDKSLFYAGGDTRLVSLDRRTTAASLPALSAHLSRSLHHHSRPFLLKYQLPAHDLDSLISLVNDDDLANMLDEHDRLSPPHRIRIFLFPVRPESLDSALMMDRKSESWFSDALKGTGVVLQKGRSADCGVFMDLESPVESGSNSGGGGGESVVLETSSSFGSTGSSLSMSNAPLIGVGNGDDKIRVPLSMERVNSVGSLASPPKTGAFQEPLIQVGPEDESSEIPVSDPSPNITTLKSYQALGYPLNQPPEAIKQLYEPQLIQPQYIPQYTGQVPISPYYHPMYQVPMHQQHIPNQPYPIYLVPIRPNQYPSMAMPSNIIDNNATNVSSRPPLHPQSSAITQMAGHKELLGAQISQSAIPTATTQLATVPSIEEGEQFVELCKTQIASEPVINASVVSAIQACEFDEDIAYSQIYKSQPSPPVLPSQYQTLTNHAQ